MSKKGLDDEKEGQNFHIDSAEEIPVKAGSEGSPSKEGIAFIERIKDEPIVANLNNTELAEANEVEAEYQVYFEERKEHHIKRLKQEKKSRFDLGPLTTAKINQDFKDDLLLCRTGPNSDANTVRIYTKWTGNQVFESSKPLDNKELMIKDVIDAMAQEYVIAFRREQQIIRDLRLLIEESIKRHEEFLKNVQQENEEKKKAKEEKEEEKKEKAEEQNRKIQKQDEKVKKKTEGEDKLRDAQRDLVIAQITGEIIKIKIIQEHLENISSQGVITESNLSHLEYSLQQAAILDNKVTNLEKELQSQNEELINGENPHDHQSNDQAERLEEKGSSLEGGPLPQSPEVYPRSTQESALTVPVPQQPLLALQTIGVVNTQKRLSESGTITTLNKGDEISEEIDVIPDPTPPAMEFKTKSDAERVDDSVLTTEGSVEEEDKIPPPLSTKEKIINGIQNPEGYTWKKGEEEIKVGSCISKKGETLTPANIGLDKGGTHKGDKYHLGEEIFNASKILAIEEIDKMLKGDPGKITQESIKELTSRARGTLLDDPEDLSKPGIANGMHSAVTGKSTEEPLYLNTPIYFYNQLFNGIVRSANTDNPENKRKTLETLRNAIKTQKYEDLHMNFRSKLIEEEKYANIGHKDPIRARTPKDLQPVGKGENINSNPAKNRVPPPQPPPPPKKLNIELQNDIKKRIELRSTRPKVENLHGITKEMLQGVKLRPVNKNSDSSGSVSLFKPPAPPTPPEEEGEYSFEVPIYEYIGPHFYLPNSNGMNIDNGQGNGQSGALNRDNWDRLEDWIKGFLKLLLVLIALLYGGPVLAVGAYCVLEIADAYRVSAREEARAREREGASTENTQGQGLGTGLGQGMRAEEAILVNTINEQPSSTFNKRMKYYGLCALAVPIIGIASGGAAIPILLVIVAGALISEALISYSEHKRKRRIAQATLDLEALKNRPQQQQQQQKPQQQRGAEFYGAEVHFMGTRKYTIKYKGAFPEESVRKTEDMIRAFHYTPPNVQMTEGAALAAMAQMRMMGRSGYGPGWPGKRNVTDVAGMGM
ncbi:MAG: hypothetical protein SFT91_03655 [Rickettsiaceae bacterium]|nr:hypothetical protein [Rickettsiaceae bacterium]